MSEDLQGLAPGQRINGFVVKAATPVDELRLTAYELAHEKSGARAMHLHADDSENLFSISFPTPPPDDTGLPHILEHAVLSGSKRFPVRDPFFEMLKMSMSTFLNAMTGWDCTYYPVASNVKADLFNLATVYFDAVFHPLLTERIFKREGHHFAAVDPEDPSGELTVSGIVFSEMKGAFSNPEARLYRCASRDLMPDTIYGRESGGDPDYIPDLTYETFCRFHETFYHPSNAYFVLYGDIPTREYTAFLEERLDAFDRIEVVPEITRQPRWTGPRRSEDTYPIGPDEPDAEKTYAVVNWLVGDATDPLEFARLYILSQFLLGNEAAPLRKAIIDSGLGQDLIYSGLGGVGLEAALHVGIKGTEADRVDAFETLVLYTLRRIAAAAMPRDRIDAAFQQTIYHYREIGEQFPLHVMDGVLSAWIYGKDPLTFLRMNAHMAAVRDEYEADPDLFNRLLLERVIDNPHRLIAVLQPDREWQARTDAAFAERMKAEKAKHDEAELIAIGREAAELQAEAAQPNSPEAVASLPQLTLADLPRVPRAIPTTLEQLPGGVELLHNDVFANGVNYLHLDFDLRGLPEDLWLYLPRYEDAIRQMGAAGMNYEQVAARISASTGGIRCRPHFDTHAADRGRSLHHLQISMKALDEQIEPALDVLGDLVFAVDPGDRSRLSDVLVQARAHYRTDLLHEGMMTALRHARRGLDIEGHLSEIVNGLPQLGSAEDLVGRFDDRAADLIEKVEAIRDFLLCRDRLTVSFTGSDPAGAAVRSRLGEWIGRMREQTVAPVGGGFTASDEPRREGLAGPMQVAFCVKVIPAPHYSHPDEPLVALAARLISFEYMLPEIRFKGNAYGASCMYASLTGMLSLSSYRDPRIAETLRVFEAVGDYVRGAGWTQTDIERAVIGTAKADERPIRPEEATGLALHRHLIGQTLELRQRRYDGVLSATAPEVKRAILDLLDANAAKGPVCVVSSREKLEAANRALGDKALSIQDVLS